MCAPRLKFTPEREFTTEDTEITEEDAALHAPLPAALRTLADVEAKDDSRATLRVAAWARAAEVVTARWT